MSEWDFYKVVTIISDFCAVGAAIVTGYIARCSYLSAKTTASLQDRYVGLAQDQSEISKYAKINSNLLPNIATPDKMASKPSNLVMVGWNGSEWVDYEESKHEIVLASCGYGFLLYKSVRLCESGACFYDRINVKDLPPESLGGLYIIATVLRVKMWEVKFLLINLKIDVSKVDASLLTLDVLRTYQTFDDALGGQLNLAYNPKDNTIDLTNL